MPFRKEVGRGYLCPRLMAHHRDEGTGRICERILLRDRLLVALVGLQQTLGVCPASGNAAHRTVPRRGDGGGPAPSIVNNAQEADLSAKQVLRSIYQEPERDPFSPA